MDKIKMDIVYATQEGIMDNPFILNGVDYEGKNYGDILMALKNNNLIKDGNFVIPKGTIINNTKNFGGATQYNLTIPNGTTLILDMDLDNN